jgi:hypothetical protein
VTHVELTAAKYYVAVQVQVLFVYNVKVATQVLQTVLLVHVAQ